MKTITGSEAMTIKEWRSKRWNRKCAFCAYEDRSYCIAKKKVVDKESLRPFCKLFLLPKP